MQGCTGHCAACGGCANQLELTPGELELLSQLCQYPFLPVARRRDDDTPIYLEDTAHTQEEYSRILQCLEKKGLISLDYDLPLGNFDDSAYAAYPVRGSFALTARGQTVAELLDIQGLS